VERPTGISALGSSSRPRHRDQHGRHRGVTLLRNVSPTTNTVPVIVGTLSRYECNDHSHFRTSKCANLVLFIFLQKL
jgi:hypothetical protein